MPVAFRNGEILLVECKISRRSLSKKLTRLKQLANKIGARLILATKSRKKNYLRKNFRETTTVAVFSPEHQL